MGPSHSVSGTPVILHCKRVPRTLRPCMFLLLWSSVGAVCWGRGSAGAEAACTFSTPQAGAGPARHVRTLEDVHQVTRDMLCRAADLGPRTS